VIFRFDEDRHVLDKKIFGGVMVNET